MEHVASTETEKTTEVHLRLDGDLAREVEDWHRWRGEIPSRPAAVRRLIARALADQMAA
jgi:hypothetical protein